MRKRKVAYVLPGIAISTATETYVYSSFFGSAHDDCFTLIVGLLCEVNSHLSMPNANVAIVDSAPGSLATDHDDLSDDNLPPSSLLLDDDSDARRRSTQFTPPNSSERGSAGTNTLGSLSSIGTPSDGIGRSRTAMASGLHLSSAAVDSIMAPDTNGRTNQPRLSTPPARFMTPTDSEPTTTSPPSSGRPGGGVRALEFSDGGDEDDADLPPMPADVADWISEVRVGPEGLEPRAELAPITKSTFHGINPHQFYARFWSDTGQLSFLDFHRQRNDTELALSEWVDLDAPVIGTAPSNTPTAGAQQAKGGADTGSGSDGEGGNGDESVVPHAQRSKSTISAAIPNQLTRTLRYRLKLNAGIMGPKSTRVEKVHRHTAYRGQVNVLDVEARSLDVPYGENFVVEERWIVRPLGRPERAGSGTGGESEPAGVQRSGEKAAGGGNEGSGCVVEVRAAVRFFKSLTFRKLIQSKSMEGVKELAQAWMDAAHAHLDQERSASSTTLRTKTSRSDSVSNLQQLQELENAKSTRDTFPAPETMGVKTVGDAQYLLTCYTALYHRQLRMDSDAQAKAAASASTQRMLQLVGVGIVAVVAVLVLGWLVLQVWAAVPSWYYESTTGSSTRGEFIQSASPGEPSSQSVLQALLQELRANESAASLLHCVLAEDCDSPSTQVKQS